MTKIKLTRSCDQYIADFDGCQEIADTPIEAIEKAHKAAIKKQEQERIQRAFERSEGFLEPIEEIEKKLPF
jgi:N-methylhydantoinase B/oxoprolinase/acetone carboxylase alpha subunit